MLSTVPVRCLSTVPRGPQSSNCHAGTELFELGIDSERRLSKPEYAEPERFTSVPREMKKLGVQWYQACSVAAFRLCCPAGRSCVTRPNAR